MKPSILVQIPQDNLKSYPIYIEKEPICNLAAKLDEQTAGRRRLVVISKKVYKLYKADFNFDKNELFILNDGENQKNIQNYLKIIEKAVSLGLSRKELMNRGVKIGADVPYCIMRGTALADGIGEKLSPLPPMVKCPVLIAKPGISVSTKFVYQNLKLDETTVHPDIDALISHIRKKNLEAICSDMGNLLETVTIPHYPVIAEIKEQMMKSGAKASMMSGSGPTVFGLFEDAQTAKRALREMKQSGLARQIYLTSIYNNRRQ